MHKTNIRILDKIHIDNSNRKIINFLFAFLIILASLAPLVSSREAQAAGRLDVYVHVNGPGEVCVRSSGEDLGCKTSDGPGMIKFKFSEDEVDVGDTFEACFNGKCINGANKPEIAPEEVYFAEPSTVANKSGTEVPDNDNIVVTNTNSADAWQLTVNMVNPPNGISSFYVYVSGPNGDTESASGIWNDYLPNKNNTSIATVIIGIPADTVPVGEMFRVCPNYDFAGSAITNSPCKWFTHNSNENMHVTVSLT
jgi:hypothetical protein